MVAAVEELGLEVDHWVTREDAGVHRFLDALLHRRNVFAGDRSADHRVLEVEALARIGADAQPDVSVLAAAAGLADVLSFRLDFLGDGLPVGDLGLADVGLDLVLAPHAVDDDVEVELAHAADDGLAGLLVGAHAERRVLDR